MWPRAARSRYDSLSIARDQPTSRGLFCRFYHVDGRSRLSAVWSPSAKGQNFDFDKDGSHGLLVKAGFLNQAHAGLFQLLPLGLRVQEKVERLVDRHMQSIGASKLSLSSISSEALWRQSGRLDNAELLHVQAKKGTQGQDKDGFLLCPTHEEEITALVARTVQSHKSLPIRLYQVSRKYRNELRPRGGLLRTREFVMKDLYTFDIDNAAAMKTYHSVVQAYRNLFDELQIPYIVAEADSGAMGGNYSHEFHFITPAGEDTLFACDVGGQPGCGYVANSELAESRKPGENGPYASPYGEENAASGGSVEAGDGCPRCAEGQLVAHRAVELGHTFHLGTRYSAPLRAAVAVEQATGKQDEVAMSMGCHGIGVSRMIAAVAAIVADRQGLNWPRVLAPWEAVIVPGQRAQSGQVEQVYDAIHKGLAPAAHVQSDSSAATPKQSPQVPTADLAVAPSPDVVIDDRASSMISKLKDADLVGYPVIVVLGKAWDQHGLLEVQCRRKQLKVEISLADLPGTVRGMLEGL